MCEMIEWKSEAFIIDTQLGLAEVTSEALVRGCMDVGFTPDLCLCPVNVEAVFNAVGVPWHRNDGIPEYTVEEDAPPPTTHAYACHCALCGKVLGLSVTDAPDVGSTLTDWVSYRNTFIERHPLRVAKRLPFCQCDNSNHNAPDSR